MRELDECLGESSALRRPACRRTGEHYYGKSSTATAALTRKCGAREVEHQQDQCHGGEQVALGCGPSRPRPAVAPAAKTSCIRIRSRSDGVTACPRVRSRRRSLRGPGRRHLGPAVHGRRRRVRSSGGRVHRRGPRRRPTGHHRRTVSRTNLIGAGGVTSAITSDVISPRCRDVRLAVLARSPHPRPEPTASDARMPAVGPRAPRRPAGLGIVQLGRRSVRHALLVPAARIRGRWSRQEGSEPASPGYALRPGERPAIAAQAPPVR